MESEIKVSIITVCFNSEKTIRQTMESVLGQTYPNIEYIIKDGGSTDGTLAIVNEYLPKFNGRLKVVSSKDKGIYDALNQAIDMATGDLISFANSDDWYEPNAVELAVEEHKKDKETFIYGIIRVVHDDKDMQVASGSHLFLPNSLIPYPTWFIPRSLFQKYGKFSLDYKIGSDCDLVLKFFKNKVRFVRIDRVLSNFRTGGASDKYMEISRMDNLRSQYKHGFISKNKMRYNILLLKMSIIIGKMKKISRSLITKIFSYD
jgi:glycosyltransferase involved in cell wall biosynthesis